MCVKAWPLLYIVYIIHFSAFFKLCVLTAKKNLSSPLLRESRPADVSTAIFPLPLIRLPNYVLVCLQTLSHFLQHYRLMQRNINFAKYACGVSYTQWCAGWATDSGHSPTVMLNDRRRLYSEVDPYWVGKTRIFDFAGKSEVTCVTETFKYPHVYDWRQYYMPLVVSSAVNWN